MGHTLIAPIGGDSKAIYAGMKEFPISKTILLSLKKDQKTALDIAKKLEDFTIKTKIILLQKNLLESMFKEFARLCSIHNNDELIVNIGAGNHGTTCAALSAAYANGLKAFDIMDDMVILLPILKLSYYHELSENKMNLLNALSDKNFEPLQEISNKLKMSISLLSYHINGNDKFKGLKNHGLIETKLINKNLYIKLSSMGKLLLKGYIKEKNK